MNRPLPQMTRAQYKQHIADWIEDEREKLGLSVMDVARIADYSVDTVTAWQQTRHMISGYAVMRLHLFFKQQHRHEFGRTRQVAAESARGVATLRREGEGV
jgi:DNA-binding transcriptional regulator YiaG